MLAAFLADIGVRLQAGIDLSEQRPLVGDCVVCHVWTIRCMKADDVHKIVTAQPLGSATVTEAENCSRTDPGNDDRSR